ncbi:ATP-binding cassette domain-containing protein [Streptomyces sp. CA-294286]|uniref:ATP-binding cassette domain-containing protein n=1 Tax=Streptomyces sp. CA-294286 TaxID=3240070 RepID=UPI003D8BC9B5
MAAEIIAEGLGKRYGSLTALDRLDLFVAAGSVMCLLGPNGAGKTTTVRMLTTLLRPDSGRATVAGYDVVRDADKLRRVIGLSGQYASVDDDLTAYENLRMMARLHHLGVRGSRARAHELLERFSLTKAADRPVKGFSGGMRRRLDLACSLVSSPSVLFLDEPTTGLDPRSRIEMWEVIRELVAAGSTLLLTTQYLEEADQLADRLAVVDHGTVIAEGTPDDLKTRVGGERLEIGLGDPADLTVARGALGTLAAGGEVSVDRGERRLTMPVTGGADQLMSALGLLKAASVEVTDFGVRRPTLDDVFLALTGRPREEALSDEDAQKSGTKPKKQKQAQDPQEKTRSPKQKETVA